jgi:hypothetical protein
MKNTTGASAQFAYAAIPLIPTLDPSLREEVQVAFADSLRVLWLVLVGVSALGLLSAALMRDVPMQGGVDKKWALEEKDHKKGKTSGSESDLNRLHGNGAEEMEMENPSAMEEAGADAAA